MRFDGAPARRGGSRALSLTRRHMIFGMGGVVVTGAGVALARIGSGGPPTAPPPLPAEHIAEIVDVTDPLTVNQRWELKTTHNALLGRIAVGDTLSFDLLVPSENGPLRSVFSGVKPDPGEQANPLLHNRNMMHVAYAAFMDKAQKAPLAVPEIEGYCAQRNAHVVEPPANAFQTNASASPTR